MQGWVTIDEKYLDYLRFKENRIPYSNYGPTKMKPFFGVLFCIDNLSYVTQISHPKPRHENMKQSLDFYKIYIPDKKSYGKDQFSGVINLNYMFPVPILYISNLEYSKIECIRSFSSEQEKSKYINLLKSEIFAINKLNIDDKAKRLYNLKKDHPEHKISKRCFDFKSLEIIANNFIK